MNPIPVFLSEGKKEGKIKNSRLKFKNKDGEL